MITVTLNATKYAFLDANAPSTPSTGNARQQIYYTDRTTILLLGFQRLASQYRFRGLGDVTLHMRATVTNYAFVDLISWSDSDFAAASVTYNTRPAKKDGWSPIYGGWNENQSGSYTAWSNENLQVWSKYAGSFLQAKSAWLDVDASCNVYTPSSGSVPYITVEVSDDNAYVKPTLRGSWSGYVDPREQLTFEWDNAVVYPTGCYSSFETPVQVSRKLMWRLSGSSSWTSTSSVSGSDTSLTVAANTLPAGKTIEFKIQITDSTGAAQETAVKTISTAAGVMYAYPSWPASASTIIDNTKANNFRWTWSNANGTRPNGADAQWSSDGGTSWNNLTSVSGSDSFSVPANTLPVSSTLSWRVRAYNIDGTAGSWSSPASFTTVDTLPVSTPMSPVGTVEDGSAPITFHWNVVNQSGAAVISSTLQWAEYGQQFTTLATISGSGTSYTVPGGTFPAGRIYWRVRSTNRQNNAGPWSSNSAYSFVNVTAPNAPSVNTDAAPFATITWQADGQQAWRLTVDGKIYGPFFGTDKSFTLPDYLPDGEHSASVEVQGQYGLWSQPGTITFTVANEPGDGIELQGSFGTDAALSWITESPVRDFLIYRDGVRIGHTAGYAFFDRLVLGAHAWRVVNRLADGNYSISNEVSGTLRSCTTQIAPAAGGEWLPLRLSEHSNDEQIFNYSRSYSLRHVAGAELPVLELSPYKDVSGTYDTAFACLQQAKAFEGLRGRVVIIKSRGDNVLIGALTELRKRAGTFSLVYEFTVQACHWEDYVDDPND